MMSGQFPSFPGGGQSGGGNPSYDDAITMLRAIAGAISGLTQAFAGLQATAGTIGQFTMPAAASLVVPNVNVKAGSQIRLTPQNASAAVLQGSNEHLYAAPADYVSGVSFTVRTGAGTNAAGTEIFSYQIINVV